jgi:hypothetical protein
VKPRAAGPFPQSDQRLVRLDQRPVIAQVHVRRAITAGVVPLR